MTEEQEKTLEKLKRAYALINAFMQWFLEHHLDYGDDVREKFDRFSEV